MTEKGRKTAGFLLLVLIPWVFWVPVFAAGKVPCALVGEVREILALHLVGEPDARAVNALDCDGFPDNLSRVDPFARWFPAGEPQKTDHPAPGIGADIFTKNGEIWLAPYAGGPLADAGLIFRVRLLAVDGRETGGMALAQAAKMLTGPSGKPLRLTLCAPPCRKRVKAEVVLRPFSPGSVEILRVNGRRLLRIRQFVAGQTRIFMETALERERAKPKNPVVLDLREATGGDLFEAMDAAAMFLAPGLPLAFTRNKAGDETVYTSPRGAKITNRLLLLVGPDTASAAEIFAGILQKHHRAVLAGSGTYGKCRSQTDRRLSDGSVLRFTNLDVLLPGKVSCHKTGIVPDAPASSPDPGNPRELIRAGMDILNSRNSNSK